ncbi:MAG: gamma-glutamylcyclotransferase [Acidimicrobiia bacterium]|nr:gamma-glutamylcyclotransferase [Acidimicrobiia bacterium]
MADRIVLYGTLRRESPQFFAFGLDYRLSYLGPCQVQGTIHDLGDYPAYRSGDGVVHGELYEVLDTDVLTDLDVYEGVSSTPALYTRRRIEVVHPPDTAWIYEYIDEPPAGSQVASGDWSQR